MASDNLGFLGPRTVLNLSLGELLSTKKLPQKLKKTHIQIWHTSVNKNCFPEARLQKLKNKIIAFNTFFTTMDSDEIGLCSRFY